MFKIFNFKSSPKETFFAPEWNYYLFEKHIKQIDFKELSSFILSKEKEISKLPTVKVGDKVLDGDTGLGENSTTSKFRSYNVLEWKNENVSKLQKIIIGFHNEILDYFNQPPTKELWIQCWVNIMRNGQQIKPHLHDTGPQTYLGGHICVQCNDTTTNYINPINQIVEPEIYQSRNEIGKITMFQNNIPHYTSIHKSDIERITIAFDLSLNKTKDNFLKII